MSGNIKVAIRTRPFDEKSNEKWAPGFEIKGSRIVFGMKIFDPDIVFDQDVSQDRVFEQCTPIIESVKDGHNGTIMVYGQTGTGKTHTMLGGEGEKSGVTFRAIENLLTYVSDRVMGGADIALTLSMVEIYNERISDMLSGNENSGEISLINGVPMGTTKITLETTQGAMATVRNALCQRHVSPTAMNERSSRSHVIVMLDLAERIESGLEKGEGEARFNTRHLYLVDLAGSESVKKSQAIGKAAAEAGMINKSLLALRSVVTALTTASSGSRVHVPYRDSKLTELLKDSVGGTARTMLIACISPVGRDIEETKNTLEYATKARKIRNNLNETEKLHSRIRNLELQLQAQINKNDGVLVITKDEAAEYRGLRQQNDELIEQCKQLLTNVEQSQAAHHVEKSVVIQLRRRVTDAVQEVHKKNTEVEELRAVYRDALLHLDHTTNEVLRSQQANWGTVGALVEQEFAKNAASLQEWSQQSLSSGQLMAAHRELIRKYHGQVQRDVQSHTADLISKAQPFAASVKQGESTWRADVEEQVARWRALQAEQEVLMNNLLRKTTAHSKETEQLAEEQTNQLCRHAQSAAEPSDLPFQHFAADLVADISSSLRQAFPSSSPSEQLQAGIRQLQEETRRSSSSTLAEMITPLATFSGVPSSTSPKMRPTMSGGLQPVKDPNASSWQSNGSVGGATGMKGKRPRLDEGTLDRPSKRPGAASPFTTQPSVK